MHTAKIFKNGRSQAVRLPKEYRFDSHEVAVSRLGDALILQPIKKTWLEVLEYISSLDGDFPEREELMPQEREPLL